MQALGDHNLVELYGCDPSILSNRDRVEDIILKSGEIANVTHIFHNFEKTQKGGVSGAEVIAESHFSIHTQPEFRYAKLDIYTCGKGMNVQGAIDYIKKELNAAHIEHAYFARGFLLENGSDKLSHLVEKELIARYDIKKEGVLNDHIIADYYRCNPERISHERTVCPALLKVARIAEPEDFASNKILVNQFHNFQPHGVSGMILGLGKHITIHTWPEHSYAAVDILVSKDNENYVDATLFLKERFGSKNMILKVFSRGNPSYLEC